MKYFIIFYLLITIHACTNNSNDTSYKSVDNNSASNINNTNNADNDNNNSQNNSDNNNNNSQNNTDPFGVTGKTSRDEVLSLVTGTTYYVDPNSGADSNPGTSESPFETIQQAQSVALSGDGVLLRNGNYGEFNEDASNDDVWLNRTSWIVYINEEGHTPVFTKIRLRYPSNLDGPGFADYPEIINSYLIFYGITIDVTPGDAGLIDPDWLATERAQSSIDTSKTDEHSWNDGDLLTYGDEYNAWKAWQVANGKSIDDAFYPRSSGNTYIKTEIPLHLWRTKYFQMYNSIVKGYERNLTKNCIEMYNSQDILFQKNDVSTCNIPFKVLGNNNTTIRNNHIHTMTSSGISEGPNNKNKVVEYNHMHDSNWDIGSFEQDYLDGDPWVPREINKNYHASAMSLRSGDGIIRGNIFHDGWDSSGIMTYNTNGVDSYSNLLIENNLIYDVHTAILRFYKAGTNITVRNNTIVGFFREDASWGVYQYYTAFAIETLADGYDGSGISIYNNIFAGGVFINYGWGKIIEDNNIFWSLHNGEEWISTDALLSDSKIITWGMESPEYLSTSLFQETPEFAKYHGQLIDFHLSEDSEAINFGDPENQPEMSLGSLDSLNKFILMNGIKRSTEKHSAGCYEK